MGRTAKTSTVLIIAVAMLLGVGVSTAAAGWTPNFSLDDYEIPGDDIKASARDITADIAAAGDDPLVEDHTFDLATTGGLVDEDWFRFDVSSHDAIAGVFYQFEAISTTDWHVNPVVEIYGPGLAFTPTPGDSLAPAVGVDPVAIEGEAFAPVWWNGHNQGVSVAFEPGAGGTYFIRVRPYGDTVLGYDDTAGPYTFRAKVGPLTRLAGADRIETAVVVSRERYPDGVLASGPGYFNLSTAIIANGYNYPDALAGASLAGICQAPILLTKTGTLPQLTADELERLDPDRVFVLGGPGAVSDAVIDEIEDIFPSVSPVTVERVSGADRVETAVEIAKRMSAVASTPSGIWPGTTPPGFAFVCSSRDFPDALSASSMSAASFAPILLTGGAGLDPRALECIRDLSITDVAIVGGTGVLDQQVEDDLVAELGPDRVIRLAGATRYETAKVFATWAAGLPANTLTVGTPGRPTALGRSNRNWIGICRGDNFPDALTAAPLCGTGWYYRAMPVLLTPSTGTSDWIVDLGGTLPAGAKSFFEEVAGVPSILGMPEKSYVFGGPGAVSDLTVWEIDSQR